MINNIPKNFTNFDIIGDIHGHSNDLKKLLSALGYTLKNNYYQHPERKVLFLGDFIDRGVNVVEVLDIVKRMVDNHEAIAIMGNHEYNAICYNTMASNGEYLRPHTKKNFNQHAVTMAAFMQKPNLYKMYIEWFKSLPLFFENDTFRVVHACWDYKSIDYLKSKLKDNHLDKDLLEEANIDGTELHNAIEIVLKGKEISLPNNQTFIDKDGILRNEFRIKWWQEPTGEPTYQSLSALPIRDLPNTPVDIKDITFYKKTDKPVFFGHYWLKFGLNEKPQILTDNACCLDFSVAKEGNLTCYRYQGEQKLNSKMINFIR